jgi:hypothetical protein
MEFEMAGYMNKISGHGPVDAVGPGGLKNYHHDNFILIFKDR